MDAGRAQKTKNLPIREARTRRSRDVGDLFLRSLASQSVAQRSISETLRKMKLGRDSALATK